MTRSVTKLSMGPGLRAVVVGVVLACAGCPSLAEQYCQTAGECDELLDPVGNSDDSVAVCAVLQQTTLDAYRANSESICQDLADAYEEWMRCAVEEGCDAWDFTSDDCRSEFNDYAETADDAGGRCEE
jgi:hypothetical protein